MNIENRKVGLYGIGFVFSKTNMAVLGLAILLTGLTFASIKSGAQSIAYYLIIAISVLACLPLFLRRSARRSAIPKKTLFLFFVPLVIFACQLFLFTSWGRYEVDLPQTIGLSFIFFFVGVAALLGPIDFRRVMMVTAFSHLLIGMYGIVQWDFQESRYAYERFGALEMHTAVWAEIALGLSLAAILSGVRILIVVATLVSAMLIYGTQMRGAGLALLTALTSFFLLTASGKVRVVGMVIIVALCLVVSVQFFDEIRSAGSSLLLLDDPHRGLQSGFSGRFQNWADGLDMFLSSPYVGVGPLDPTAAYTHNGILKMFAQYGLFFGVLLSGLLILSIKRAFLSSDPYLFACLLGYVVFIMTAPRFLNFQIMPMVALFAAGYALCGKKLRDVG